MGDKNPPTILLAEEDAKSRDTLGVFLSRAGWSFDVANDAPQALQAASVREYDVVITDLDMRSSDWQGFLTNLRNIRPEQAFIVLSSTCSTQQAMDCLRHGAADMLHKPVDYDCLSRAVSRVMDRLRKLELHNDFYQYLKSQSLYFEFSSAELARCRIQLPLIDKLWRLGIIEHALKMRLELAFGEALINALDHGNLELKSEWREEIDAQGIDRFSLMKQQRLTDSKYAKRKVFLEVHYTNGWLTIKIKDQGKGFLRGKKELVAKSSDDLHCYGRGISIMNSLMDEIRFKAHGTELTMKKQLVKGEG